MNTFTYNFLPNDTIWVLLNNKIYEGQCLEVTIKSYVDNTTSSIITDTTYKVLTKCDNLIVNVLEADTYTTFSDVSAALEQSIQNCA